MTDEIREAKDIVQRCIAIATVWVGRPGNAVDEEADEETRNLLKELADEMPEEMLRPAYFTACMMLGMIADFASESMVGEDDSEVTPQDILGRISLTAEGWFA